MDQILLRRKTNVSDVDTSYTLPIKPACTETPSAEIVSALVTLLAFAENLKEKARPDKQATT